MNVNRKIEIYRYIQNYRKQKEEHEDYIDYYELCGFEKDLSMEMLYKKMREVKRCLHPDQLSYVEDIFQPDFMELSEKVPDMENIFSNFRLKEEYDYLLENKRKSCNEEKLEEVMKNIISQNGILAGITSLESMLFLDNHQEVPLENSIRQSLEKFGKEEIISIIKSKNKDLMEEDLTNMVMDYYIEVLNKTSMKEKMDSFYQTCKQTSKKYDHDDQNYQLENALVMYVMNRKADGFTNEENARKRFVDSNLDPNDVSILMLAKIHQNKDKDKNYSYVNMLNQPFDHQVRTFAKIINQEVMKEKAMTHKTI